MALIPLVRIPDTTYLHNGMILSTLGLSPHGFAFGLTPKGLIPMEIFVHPYIPMILPTSSQCGTIGRIPNTKRSQVQNQRGVEYVCLRRLSSQIAARRWVPCPTNKGVSYTNLGSHTPIWCLAWL